MFSVVWSEQAAPQGTFDLVVLSGSMVSGSVAREDVEAGFVELLDETELEVTADADWQLNADVMVVSNPSGTGNPVAAALEVGNNTNPGEFIAGGGLVATGSSGTVSVLVDYQLNLSTLGAAPGGAYEYLVTFTVTDL